MRATEKAIYRYYNDMGKAKGNCTWGAGILAHKGICTEDELKQKVSAKMVDQEFERRVADAEGIVRRNTTKALNQRQFDALVSLAYNSGGRGARDTFDFVNRGDFAGAAKNIASMVKVGVTEKGKKKYVVAPGLIKRREEEAAPFRVKEDAASSASQ
jgi:GH24 family phage-related lysozyme (muramidase)